MYKIVYLVKTDSEELHFDTEAEAIEFAENHCEEHPVVEAIDCELNEFGEVECENGREVIWQGEDECCDNEESVVCNWCGKEVPAADCLVEKDLGHVCSHCVEEKKAEEEDMIFIESDCREVPCEVEEVISHSEDEKPLDCKMEKAPLEKPLVESDGVLTWEVWTLDGDDLGIVKARTEEEAYIKAEETFPEYGDELTVEPADDLSENVNINVSADRPEELVSLAKALLGDDFAAFDQDFDAPVEVIPPAELGAGFEMKPEDKEAEYVDPFEKNPFDEHPEDDEPEVSEEEPEEDSEEEQEEVETEFDKEMEAKADKRPADEQPMDMIDGKLVPAKDPKEAEVEVDEGYTERPVVDGFDDFDLQEQPEEHEDEYVDLSDEELAQMFAEALQKRRELTEAGLFGLGKNKVDKIFSSFYCMLYKVNGNKAKKTFETNNNTLKDAEKFAQEKSKKDNTIKEIQVWAEKCAPEFEKVFKETVEDFKLPVMLRIYKQGKVTIDNFAKFEQSEKPKKQAAAKSEPDLNEEGLVKLTIKKQPDRKEFIKGNDVDLTGLVLEGEYADGEQVEVDSGYDYDPKKAPKEVGKFTILVRYGGQIVELELESIDHELTWAEQHRKELAAAKNAAENPVKQASSPTKGQNNAKIKKALEDAGYSVDDLFTEDEEGNQKATEKLINLRKALFNEGVK